MRKAGKRKTFLLGPGGLRHCSSQLPHHPASSRSPAAVREGLGAGRPGRAGPQKLGPQEQVGEAATGQAPDPGHPKAPSACTDIISALKGHAVFSQSSMALLTTKRRGHREGPEAGNVSREESAVPRIVLQPWLPASVLII